LVLQTKRTDVAKRLSANLKPAAGMSSPGGEETGEGELNHRGRQSALTFCFRPSIFRSLAFLPLRILALPPKIAKRTQFNSQPPVLKTLTTKKFPFCSKANLIEIFDAGHLSPLHMA